MLIRVEEYEEMLKVKNNISDIKVYKENIKGYERWIICCNIVDCDTLKKTWRGISEDVAIDIQTKLEKMISRMNIYLLYFVESVKDPLLKAKIENDKFSSRKIVVAQNIPTENELPSFIEQRLFLINVNSIDRSHEKSLRQYFEENDKILFALYSFGEKDYEKVLDRYTKIGGEGHE